MSSVRLSGEMQEKLRRVAALNGLTVSEVHRRALEQYCDREPGAKRPSRFDDVIGVAEGPPDLSSRAADDLADILAEMHG